MRPAHPGERLAVTSIAKRFHGASGIPFPFDAAHAAATAQEYIEASDKLCLALEVDGVLRGALAASASISPLVPARVAEELIFWIDPECRGRAALKMISAYEQWARDQGCIAIGLSALGDPRVARLFRASGFALIENKFLKMVV